MKAQVIDIRRAFRRQILELRRVHATPKEMARHAHYISNRNQNISPPPRVIIERESGLVSEICVSPVVFSLARYPSFAVGDFSAVILSSSRTLRDCAAARSCP